MGMHPVQPVRRWRHSQGLARKSPPRNGEGPSDGARTEIQYFSGRTILPAAEKTISRTEPRQAIPIGVAAAMAEKSSELALPALVPLGDLAGAKPTIVIDSREQSPLTFTRLQSVEGTLYSGDYSVRGLEELFAIERKTVADLTACCCGDNRARFERELHRLRGFVFKRLLIIGSEEQILRGQYRRALRRKLSSVRWRPGNAVSMCRLSLSPS